MDKGVADFGVILGAVDQGKYDVLTLPVKDAWGILMRKDAPLAEKDVIRAEDLWDKPLIISRQGNSRDRISQWLKKSLLS